MNLVHFSAVWPCNRTKFVKRACHRVVASSKCFPIAMSRRARVRVEAVMRRQRGLVTRYQARSVGMTEDQIAKRLERGEWEIVHRAVFRSAATPVTWHQHVLGATLAVDGVASHRTAAVLHGLPGPRRPSPEITYDRNRRHRTLVGVRAHRSTQWEGRQEVSLHGVPATGIERTLLDCGAKVSVDSLERMAEDAVRRCLTDFDQLARYLVMHSRRGRAGSATLRAMLLRRDPNARLPLSDFSRLMYQLIVSAGLPQPELEYRIVDRAGTFVMQTDLAWPHLKKAIELDGLQWHFGRAEVERDRRKRARARADGWQVLEVLWTMYDRERPELCDLLARFLAS